MGQGSEHMTRSAVPFREALSRAKPRMLVPRPTWPQSPRSLLMAILAEVMASVVTTTSLLWTIGGEDVIQITPGSRCIVRAAIGGRPHRMAVV